MDEARQRHWRMLSEQLDIALELGEEERGAWLEALSARAPELAASMRGLLAERAALSDRPLPGDGVIPELAHSNQSGETIGAYTLEEIVGHGGMGTVWRARRSDGRYEARVAIKFLNRALIGRPAERRFVREGSVLARLRHPNIAQLIDAGVAAGGQPYLVLEFVDGERIDAYAERRNLSVAARIRLFLDVLAAVSHAHRQLIVHRDLKPSNIFVTDAGVVKLLDFGVAALLGDGGADLTREGGAGLTPDYAAPEQLLGGAVTTATDVYALGLTLFVLLVGRHPLGMEGQSVPERLRATLETEAPRVSQLAGDLAYGKALRGDIDTIVAKALKKDSQERYGTAELLAQELQRYLAHEPITARPDSLGYRASKFVRRHRGGVIAGTLTALALAAAMAITSVEMVAARRERDEAQFQARRAEYQARYAYQIMSELGSDDRPITIRELMHKGIEVLEKNYSDDPRFMIAALINISGRYMDLGDTEKEHAALVEAEQIARKLGDPEEIASVQCNTVETALQAGHPDEAAARMRDGLANAAKVGKLSMSTRLDCETAQARFLWSQNNIDGAISTATTVAHELESQHLETDVRYTTVTSMLEILLSDSGHTREAMIGTAAESPRSSGADAARQCR